MARAIAMLIRALIVPHTLEYLSPDFSAIRADSFFSMVVASLPNIPSVDATKGEKCRRLLQTRLEIFPLLLSFVLLEDFSWVLGAVGRCIRVREPDGNDTVSTILPEASD